MIRPTGALVLLLALPGLVQGQQSADGTGPATVTGVQVRGVSPAGPSQQDAGSYEARRRALESRPFEPMSVPELPLEERTVFFELPQARPDPMVIVATLNEQTTAFSLSTFQRAGWLLPTGARPDRLGTVLNLIDWPSEASDIYGEIFGDIRFEITAQGSPRPGDQFLLYGIDRTIDGVGQVAVPSGRVEVLEVEGTEALAEIVQVFGRIRTGDFVTAVGTLPLGPGVHPAEFDGDVEGRILALQRDQATHRSGDFAFVDIGRNEGLALGDELVGVAERPEDWPGRGLARFQVVGVRDETATLRILSTVAPTEIRTGLRVVVDRKMP
jgi:hypothetical protein